MNVRLLSVIVYALVLCSVAMAEERASWWNPRWRLRTTVTRACPYRDGLPRPVEVAADFPLLLEQAAISGEFDPASLRVIERSAQDTGTEVPFTYRSEFDATQDQERSYLAWTAHPQVGQCGVYDIYFDVKDRHLEPASYDANLLPPENLLVNPGFEEESGGKPVGWTVSSSELVSLGKFAYTTGERSLKVVVDGHTPEDTEREATISQTTDIRKFAGQEMVFKCDLLAERAAYGAPVCIELQQFREDGSRILECAVQPRWLTIELAEGQLVQFRERGKFSHEATTVKVRVRIRCEVKDADTDEVITGPDSFFTIWLDHLVVRPAERWPWPAASNAGFARGALETAPLNRGFQFTGQRRLAFNGASEGTLTANTFNPNIKSVHWGLQAGTLELWCRPLWDADDGVQHIFFDAVAYGWRRQSCLRKLDAKGNNELEFTIADADGDRHTVRGPAPLRAGRWHHIAATWDLPKAHLQLFLDGKVVASQGPGDVAWASSLVAVREDKKKGMGIWGDDSRSMPMQAFIGGDKNCRRDRAAEAALDELRISDISRYSRDFSPPRKEFKIDKYTRVLFHFENEHHGVHDSDDRFVRGHLICELPPQQQKVPLDICKLGKIDHRMVLVKPYASGELFEANRAENRVLARRPFRKLPDPRFVEYRRRQVERTITAADDEFVLNVGGDYEPLMNSITFEHVKGSSARTTLVPRWRANDNVVPFSVGTIAATLAPDAVDDVEKAFEAFKYAVQVTNYFDAHYCETLPSRHRSRVSYTLLKALNIYPFDQCGPLNYTLRKLFLAVGISSNDASGTHHQFEQAFYQGSWRLFDLSPRIYWLNRDNTTVVSRRGFEEDPYLKLRQGSGINSGLCGRRSGARFGVARRPHNMNFPLCPGERTSICWHNEGRWFEVSGEKRQPIPLAKIPPYFGNGAIIYEPTLQGGAAELDNMVVEMLDGGTTALRPQDVARPATLVYHARCPYIFSAGVVGGIHAAQQAGAVSLSLSFDEGKTWTEVWHSPNKDGEIDADILEQITGRYCYWLKLELAPGQGATVKGLKVRTTFVASPLVLPGKLSRGANRITFVGGLSNVPVKTSCRWVERYRSDLRIGLNSISYYMNGDEAHRNLLTAAPSREMQVSVILQGRQLRGEVALEGLPATWMPDGNRCEVELADTTKPKVVNFRVRPKSAAPGEIRGFDVVLEDSKHKRRVPAQVLVADAPLVREAEDADETTGDAAPVDLPEASGARVIAFSGDGKLGFGLKAHQEGNYALWLRARWDRGSDTHMTLRVNEKEERKLGAAALIGFTDWTDPERAHSKVFAHFGEQYTHWAWYRIPDVHLTPGKHRLTLSAGAGAYFDALVVLPQNPVMDRAAMNLFQNWNYAPWDKPF